MAVAVVQRREQEQMGERHSEEGERELEFDLGGGRGRLAREQTERS